MHEQSSAATGALIEGTTVASRTVGVAVGAITVAELVLGCGAGLA